MSGLRTRRLDLASATVLVIVLGAGCQPEVLIASSEPPMSGAAGVGGAGGAAAGAGGSGGNAGTGGTGDVVPSAGDAGSTTVAEPPRLLADSVADFSLTQGELNWSYGYDLGSLESFTLLNRKSVITAYVNASSDRWDCWANDTAHWTQIFALGAHPNGTESSSPKNGILQRAVRRWTSPFAADVIITGEIAKIDTGSLSNGIDAFVYVDGVQRYTTFIAGDDAGGRRYEVVATLHEGSTVDFVLDPHESADHNDLSRFTGIIVRVLPGPAE